MHKHARLYWCSSVARRSACGAVVTFVLSCGPMTAAIAGPLHQAAEAGDVQAMKELIRAGEDVNQQDEFGRSPLHIAAARSNRRVVAILIAVGANVDQADANGTTPLQVAAAEDEPSVARLLVEQDANPNAKDVNGQTALHKAALAGSTSIIDILFESGVDSEIRDNSGLTAADLARKNESLEALRHLVRKTGRMDHDKFREMYKRAQDVMRW